MQYVCPVGVNSMVINGQTLVGEYQGMCLTFLVSPETVSNDERFRQLSFTRDYTSDVSSLLVQAMTRSLICLPGAGRLVEYAMTVESTA
jgi:hypothetical protein